MKNFVNSACEYIMALIALILVQPLVMLLAILCPMALVKGLKGLSQAYSDEIDKRSGRANN